MKNNFFILVALFLLGGITPNCFASGNAEQDSAFFGALGGFVGGLIDDAVESNRSPSSSSSSSGGSSGPTYYYSIYSGTFSSSEGWSTLGYAGGGSVTKGDIFNSTHKNNPNSTSITNFGPLPAGTWTITGVDSSITNNTILLTPTFSTNRTGIAIHGDSIDAAYRGMISRGCIVIGLDERQKIVDAFNRYGQLTLVVHEY